MSRKANPTVIGAFVVGALAIAVIAVLVLSSGQLFQKKLPVIMHFEGSVKGLSVGAPVRFRGVQIGTVTNVSIVISPDRAVRIPVSAEIDLGSFTLVGYDSAMDIDEFREGVSRDTHTEGLRAQLQLQSLLTGQLFIQLDYYPDTPARFVEDGKVTEIPTIPTTLQEFSSMLQDFPVREVLDNLAKTSAALAQLTSDEEIGAAIAAAKRALDDVSELVARLETRTRPLEPMLVDAQQALAESRKTFAQASETLAAAERTFNEASATLAPMKSLVSDDSELLGAIDDALAAMTDAARAVAALAETLERRPEALIKGKGVLGGD